MPPVQASKGIVLIKTCTLTRDSMDFRSANNKLQFFAKDLIKWFRLTEPLTVDLKVSTNELPDAVKLTHVAGTLWRVVRPKDGRKMKTEMYARTTAQLLKLGSTVFIQAEGTS